MILIQLDSSLLKTALDAENSFLYWMKHDTSTIDNTQYSAIQAKFSAWQDAYEEDDLYITTGSTLTHKPITTMDEQFNRVFNLLRSNFFRDFNDIVMHNCLFCG